MNGEVNKTVAILQAKQIAKTYGNKQTEQEVLKDIDLSIEAGEFVAIMGPSGSGKTTLLNVLSSIDYLTHGSIILDGQQLEKLSNKALSEIRKKDIGFIFQEYNLLHTLTVKENIMLPLSVQKLDKKEMNERYQRITQALNIFEISDKYPSDISGGQRQRTSAARAFITYPKIIFADEPTGALDTKNTRDLLQRFQKINELYNATIVMVTHDPLAASFSERVIMLKDGQVFTEIYQGEDDKNVFHKEILRAQSILGGMMYEF
ncbi:ABC transporter--like protein [Mycobacteroides abscessus subsp. abscessus]|nr:ABC transporter ATP-binding protein [Staphylococcus haemolyticus]SIK02193.1 ABC transporter--like protein [Mycobacteroides abscessus subsp. abscessus]